MEHLLFSVYNNCVNQTSTLQTSTHPKSEQTQTENTKAEKSPYKVGCRPENQVNIEKAIYKKTNVLLSCHQEGAPVETAV